MHRDHLVWWLGLFGGVLAVVAAQADVFPPEAKPYITLAASIVAAVSGWMKTSPLPGEPKE